MVDKETQIKVLLSGKALDFACETLGVKDMRTRKYVEVFTVSPEEVYEYTTIHGIPHSDSTGKNSLAEDFHYYEEEGKWYTFFRERGHIFDEKCFDDDELGKKYIVTTLLQLSGTGLYYKNDAYTLGNKKDKTDESAHCLVLFVYFFTS
ncbi:hypothetical protein SAMN05518871_107187 [Psychrobacillus sp. OK028]|uniref:hypothetical protein n=1 Tax=Psychrobacillus sp. OK028 TaxID=1884359 RepID=UPI00088DCBF1|nr:hypothetical protein [Psychrobacillus sp. OK028]SDN77728.1 hypothetical protein SAMN05518871_107187 [Psychrobacillus sp. OK028]